MTKLLDSQERAIYPSLLHQVKIYVSRRMNPALHSLAFAGVFCLVLAANSGAQGTPTGTISGGILDTAWSGAQKVPGDCG